MPDELVPPIEPRGVGSEQPLHTGHKIWLRGFRHEVNVVFHQAIGMDLPAGFLAGIAQRSEEGLTIFVIKEDRLTPISTAHQVVDGSRKLNAQRSRHATIEENAGKD
jgi:hypothetical protein